jgi:hypothetical protein
MSETLISDGNPDAALTAKDYDSQGNLKTKAADLALVCQSASTAEAFISSKQWGLMWRDADLLFQSPRPMSVFENTYILEPNVQRFTVAKVCNAIVPQLYKGLFYDNPPMILRPRPGTSQTVIDAKTALFSYLLDTCNFKRETKWGLEQMALLGTGVWKWGKEYKTITIKKRQATVANIPSGDNTPGTSTVVTDEKPKITTEEKVICHPFFEWRSVQQVLVDPHTPVGDIRFADFVNDVRYMDWYQIDELRKSVTNKEGKLMDGWDFPADLQECWLPPLAEDSAPRLRSDQQTYTTGIVHHSQDMQIDVSPDALFRKLEVLEYWDKKRKIVVLNRKKVLFTGENEFKEIPFLSANWWNRPKAFYGMGIGLIVGQNQRVDQGTINAILKMLSLGVNPVYLRNRNANSPTQMLRSGLGRILTVDGELKNAYSLLETPKVPTEVWSALSESEKATESSSGADQMLVQGSTSGPRSSMGRTAGGANILAGASATRLDGPLDNFIEQVFKPFLYILDKLVFEYMTDKEIMDVLGKELGNAFRVDMQEFHDAVIEYEVLAGASLAAKRQMAQSLTLITQIFENPTIQNNLAEINGEYIDFKPILNMWMEASEWKNRNDIIKPLTDEMKQRMAQKTQQAQQQSQAAVQSQSNQQKFEQKAQLEDQANDNRIKRDLVREAFRKDSMDEATTGEASDTSGLESGPEVV